MSQNILQFLNVKKLKIQEHDPSSNYFEETGKPSAMNNENKLSRQIHINDLPIEILLKIFSYFDILALCSMGKVCTRWQNICLDRSLWKNLSFKDPGGIMFLLYNFIETCIRGSPWLKSFKITTHSPISRLLLTISAYCPHLKKLSLNDSSVTSVSVEEFVRGCPKLTYLSIHNVFDRGSDSTNYLPFASLKHLTYLEISECKWVDDEFILTMAKNASKLEILKLEGCRNFEIASLCEILSQCKNTLKGLSFTCYADKQLFNIVNECKKLEELTVFELIPRLEDSDIDIVLNKLSNLKILTYILTDTQPNSFNLILPKYSKLQALYLQIRDSIHFNSSCILDCVPQLNVLALHCPSLDTSSLLQIIDMSKNLRVLILENVQNLTIESLERAFHDSLILMQLNNCNIELKNINGLIEKLNGRGHEILNASKNILDFFYISDWISQQNTDTDLNKLEKYISYQVLLNMLTD